MNKKKQIKYGRIGGKIGGPIGGLTTGPAKARTPEQASAAAKVRWDKYRAKIRSKADR